jgi:hypothetical protein
MNSLTKFEKELSVNEKGIGSMSRRALAMCCGVKMQSWGRGDSIFNAEIDERLAKYGFEGDSIFDENGKIVDQVCALVIKHYSRKGKEEAEKWDDLIGMYGIRQLIRDACGYQETRSLTPEEVIELCCLPVPTEWQRRFPVEYYQHLERLTGLKPDGHKRPQLWAKLTKELVYDYLPTGIYQKIKQCKDETGSWEKLHQFLSNEGLLILEKHQQSLLAYMEASASLDDLHRLINQASTKRYQLVLF